MLELLLGERRVGVDGAYLPGFDPLELPTVCDQLLELVRHRDHIAPASRLVSVAHHRASDPKVVRVVSKGGIEAPVGFAGTVAALEHLRQTHEGIDDAGTVIRETE